MPLSKKKSTTSNTDPAAVEQASSPLPEQQTFQEQLRALTRGAVRVVIEEVMQEELKQFLGAAWGEFTSQRKGYRNGNYTRDLATSSGPIEDLAVPRDREGHFPTQVFDRTAEMSFKWPKDSHRCSWQESVPKKWGKSLRPLWEWPLVQVRSVASIKP